MKRTNLKTLFIICLVILVAITSKISSASDVGVVRLGSSVILRFYSDRNFDPVERARIVQGRIESLLGSGLSPDDVKVVNKNYTFMIYWGKELIIQVDEKQALLNNSRPESLAQVWAANLKKAIKENAFVLVPSYVELPLNSSTNVKIAGYATGTIVREHEEGNVILNINEADREIKVLSNFTGRNRVVLRRGNARAQLVIDVKEVAAEIPSKIETHVSGNPAPHYVLKYAASNAVKTSIRLKPGAQFEIGGEIRTAMNLESGKTDTAYVPVFIYGRNYIPVKADIPVTIINTGISFSDIKVLMVSDRPEAIDKDGILFKANFSIGQPTRLLYYHKNASNKNRVLWVELVNNSDSTARVMVGGAIAGPSLWGMTVGHVAALRFLETHKDGISCTLQIPPGEAVSLIDITMPSHQVAAGYLHMQIIEGKNLDVLVKNSADEKKDRVELPILHQPFDPFKIHPKGVFQPANFFEEVSYQVGQEEDAVCIFGRAPWLIDASTGEPNNGNYGVFYNFKLNFSNPTSQKKRIGFFFVPEGIVARGSFILDGKIMETGIVRKPDKQLFAILDLKPGETREYTLLTTPEGGSYYPVRVIIKTVEENAKVELSGKKDDAKLEEEIRKMENNEDFND